MNADYYARRGESYSKFTIHTMAQSDFDEAIKIDPNNAEYYLLKGNDYFIQGMYNSAEKNYNKSLSLKNSAVAYYKRGNAKYMSFQIADAISDYTNAIKENKSNYTGVNSSSVVTKAYRNRGIARYETCKSGACSDLKKAGNLGDSKAYNEYQRIKNKGECE